MLYVLRHYQTLFFFLLSDLNLNRSPGQGCILAGVAEQNIGIHTVHKAVHVHVTEETVHLRYAADGILLSVRYEKLPRKDCKYSIFRLK